MATGFDVDIQALQTLARDLGEALQAMAAARGELATASHGQTGDGALDGACGEFQGKWGYGLQQLEKTTGAFALGLEETVKAYRAVEGEIEKSFGGNGGSHGVLTPVTHGGGHYEPGPIYRHSGLGPAPEPVAGQIPTPRIHFGPTPVPPSGGSAQ